MALCLGLLSACGDADSGATAMAELAAGEELPGGEATNTLLFGSNAFIRHAPNLTPEHEAAFFTGNSLFNDSWVEAPASTTARDGLGPTFNARSCSGCHFKDGRGQPPGADGTGVGLLIRLSVAGEGEHGAPVGHPAYGGQLQDGAIPQVPAEGRIAIDYQAMEGEYADGESYTLMQPLYSIADPAFGVPPYDLRMSPRVAPQVIGLGLLEAIPESRLQAQADPEDDDGDGISGRINWVWDVRAAVLAAGRFGWKAEQPSVLQQSAGAFNGDMGITTSLFPNQNCPEAQSECAAALDGGEPEIEDALLEKVGLYSATLAVPARRNHSAPEVLRGKRLFGEAGCDGCHTPNHQTSAGPIEELKGQSIWPYTDMLLHDMGDALSDHRPSFGAEGGEWRTPPLWGIGRFQDVNGHTLLMHDGRADGVADAILWHGAEGQAAADAFRELDAGSRQDLIQFVESL